MSASGTAAAASYAPHQQATLLHGTKSDLEPSTCRYAFTELMTPLSQLSVRTLLLWLVLACLLPGAIGAGFLFTYQYKEGRTQLEQETIRTARALTQAVDSYLLTVQAMGEALATADSLAQGNLSQFHARARKLIDTSELVANVVLRKRDEQLALNALIPFGTPLPEQPSRQHVRRVFSTAAPSISNLYRVRQFSHPIISVDVPVVINGEVAYSLGLSVFPENLNAILRSQSLPAGWVAAIFDRSATIVARNISPEKFVGNQATSLLLQAMRQSREGSVAAISQEGTPLQTAYSRSTATGWGVAIGTPRQFLHRAMVMSITKLAVGVLALFAIALVLAWFIGGRIAISVRNLTGPAMALGNGEPVKVPRVYLHEAAEVGAAIIHAADLLSQREAALEAGKTELAQAHRRLRDVIDSSPALIYLKDLEGRFLLVNKTYERLIGSGTSRFRMAYKSSRSHSELQGPSAADLKVLRSGSSVQFEEEIETAEGRKYFAISKAPLRDHEGKIIGMCGAAVDITSLKKAESQVQDLVATLEKRVEQRTDELQAVNMQLLDTNSRLEDANSQLEAYNYTVAHDLRAPLRGIQGFADALKEDYEETLDENGRDYLQRISSAAGRMEQLIDDLLGYSRLSRMALTFRTVELDNVLRQVLTNLDMQVRESSAHIVVAPDLPSVYANRAACLQIFQNLISNAIKFSRPGAGISIKVWAEQRRNEHAATNFVRVWIEDNGIGIPALHHERIFKPFERLHGMSEYAGSGIGLAIVEMAARRMNGRCGLESVVNAGSRFWVELPAPPLENQ